MWAIAIVNAPTSVKIFSKSSPSKSWPKKATRLKINKPIAPINNIEMFLCFLQPIVSANNEIGTTAITIQI